MNEREASVRASLRLRLGLGGLGLLCVVALWGQLRGGHDLLATWMAGAGPVLLAAGTVTVLSFVIGIAAGSASTFGPPLFDTLLSRLIEISGALPSVIVVFVVRALHPLGGLFSLVFVLAILRGLSSAKGVRAEVQQLSREDFVLSTRALGATDARLLRRHILPYVVPPALADALVSASAVVALDAAGAYLGLGARADTWGDLLAKAAEGAGPAYAALPALGVALTAGALWLIADSLSARARAMPRQLP